MPPRLVAKLHTSTIARPLEQSLRSLKPDTRAAVIELAMHLVDHFVHPAWTDWVLPLRLSRKRTASKRILQDFVPMALSCLSPEQATRVFRLAAELDSLSVIQTVIATRRASISADIAPLLDLAEGLVRKGFRYPARVLDDLFVLACTSPTKAHAVAGHLIRLLAGIYVSKDAELGGSIQAARLLTDDRFSEWLSLVDCLVAHEIDPIECGLYGSGCWEWISALPFSDFASKAQNVRSLIIERHGRWVFDHARGWLADAMRDLTAERIAECAGFAVVGANVRNCVLAYRNACASLDETQLSRVLLLARSFVSHGVSPTPLLVTAVRHKDEIGLTEDRSEAIDIFVAGSLTSGLAVVQLWPWVERVVLAGDDATSLTGSLDAIGTLLKLAKEADVPVDVLLNHMHLIERANDYRKANVAYRLIYSPEVTENTEEPSWALAHGAGGGYDMVTRVVAPATVRLLPET